MNFDRSSFLDSFFDINDQNFEKKALDVFRHQVIFCPVYKDYIQYLKKDIYSVNSLNDIPFLPIEFFKSHEVLSVDKKPVKVFESSGTTGMERSKHLVVDPDHYLKVAQNYFEQCYGPLTDYHIFALLPSYLERDTSSLVAMVNHFIKESKSDKGGFFLDEIAEMKKRIEALRSQKTRKILLVGVTFALLDMGEKYDLDWADVIIMETGGMKGRRKELTRNEVHDLIQQNFGVKQVHSEYGMTELLSQAYSKGQGIFTLPPWMKFFLRELHDPFAINQTMTSGVLNIIDLANIDSCAFLETKDIARCTKHDANEWEILGRVDHSDIRGCNLLVS